MGNSPSQWNQDQQSRKKWKQYNYLMKKLHQMRKSLGEEPVQNFIIKKDQFEKLREQFSKAAHKYEQSNRSLNNNLQPIQKAKMVFQLTQKKIIMENCLKQMTTLTKKLLNRLPKKKKMRKKLKEQSSEKFISMCQSEDSENQLSPQQKQLEYKNLVLYNMQNTYFKLIKTEKKDTQSIRYNIKQNKFSSLQELINNSPARPILHEQENLDIGPSLQEKQMLQNLKQIDDMIQQKMDVILQGLKVINYNALAISDSLNVVHKKVLINLDKVTTNQVQLQHNRKLIKQASKHVSKPSCIMNIIFLVVLGIMIYFIIDKLIIKKN